VFTKEMTRTKRSIALTSDDPDDNPMGTERDAASLQTRAQDLCRTRQ
jgi:hypothetical protein